MKIKIAMGPETTEALKMTLICDCDENLQDVLTKLKRCAALSDNLSAVTFERMYNQWFYAIDDDDSEGDSFTWSITPKELNDLLANMFDLATELYEELIETQVKAEIDEMKHFTQRRTNIM